MHLQPHAADGVLSMASSLHVVGQKGLRVVQSGIARERVINKGKSRALNVTPLSASYPACQCVCLSVCHDLPLH